MDASPGGGDDPYEVPGSLGRAKVLTRGNARVSEMERIFVTCSDGQVGMWLTFTEALETASGLSGSVPFAGPECLELR